jgi:hypothetical protein
MVALLADVMLDCLSAVCTVVVYDQPHGLRVVEGRLFWRMEIRAGRVPKATLPSRED